MNRKKFPSTGPSITGLEIELVNDAMKLGWYDNRNMHIDQFVDEFSSIIKKIYIYQLIVALLQFIYRF